MKRKIKVLFVFLVLISFSASVFAEIPKGSVIIGKKGFTFEYANDDENTTEIRNAIKSMKQGEEILIKNKRGDWYRNNGKKTSLNPLTEISYTMNDGSIVQYKGESLKQEDGFRVLNVSFVSRDKLEIIFSEAIKENGYFDKVDIDGYLEVKRHYISADQKRIYVLIEPINTTVYDAKVTISQGLMNNDGIAMKNEYTQVVSAFTKNEEKKRTFDSYMSITNDFFKGEDLKFNERVNITGENVELKNCEAKELILNPGTAGNVTLDNIEADKVIIYSGGQNSIHLNKSKIKEISIMAYSNVRVVDEEKNEIDSINIYSDAIIQTKERLNNIIVNKSEKKKEIKVIGKVTNLELMDNSILVTGENSKVDNVNFSGKVELKGSFGEVYSNDSKAKVKILDGSNIKSMNIKEKTEVEVDGSVDIEEIQGAEKFKDDIKEKLANAKILSNEEDKVDEYKFSKIERHGLELLLNESREYRIINDKKYRFYKVSVLFDEKMLTDRDKENILLYIYGKHRRLIDIKKLELIENRASDIRFYCEEKEGVTFSFFLEEQGRIDIYHD